MTARHTHPIDFPQTRRLMQCFCAAMDRKKERKEKQMSFISMFDVLGPNMVGPSSSHTAGACSIALIARKMLGEPVRQVDFTLYGSFAKTYRGHGTDRALLGGIMGFSTDDERIPQAYALAGEQGVSYHFSYNHTETDLHPNTVDIKLTGAEGHAFSLRGESVGGGKIRISRINGIAVDFSGDYNTLIVVHKDRIGIAAHITRCLSEGMVNIAFMRLFREAKGDTAYSIVEYDGTLSTDVQQKIREKEDVNQVMVIPIQEEK